MRAVSIAVSLALVACSSGTTATYTVALGARGEVSDWLGPCGTSSSPAIRSMSPTSYEAVAVGDAELACRDGTMLVQVRRPARLVVRAVARSRVGTNLAYGVDAFDASGAQLDLGDAPVAWTFTGALAARAYPGCSDVIVLCPAMNDGFARATSVGAGVATASFGGLTATTTTTVAP